MTKEEALEILLTRKPFTAMKCTGCNGLGYHVVTRSDVDRCEICMGEGWETDPTYALARTTLGEDTSIDYSRKNASLVTLKLSHQDYFTTFRVRPQ